MFQLAVRMKVFCLFAVFALIVCCQGRQYRPDEIASIARLAPAVGIRAPLSSHVKNLKVNMNDFVDRMMEKARDFMLENGLDPMQLPDTVEKFEVTDLIGIKWQGELDLVKGWLQDLSTIFRTGDVSVVYKDKKMHIEAEIGFKDLVFNYDFTARVMKLSESGMVNGKASDVKIVFKAIADIFTKTIALDDLQISHVGDIDIQFNGLGTIANFIVDKLTEVVIALFKEPILEMVETEVRKTLEDVLANIDIGDIIGGFRY
ncbi:hypothetical protein J437_LFUL002490 [Ladona fulva]|uniref:Uncharacterized protein n=1 Tax=Ladona fulva TaxID=123851 RepID=A0A8K0NU28_LADFU|nr:hypothetical protein J437_LFUL002490 [Ladona fulva]